MVAIIQTQSHNICMVYVIFLLDWVHFNVASAGEVAGIHAAAVVDDGETAGNSGFLCISNLDEPQGRR